MGLLSSLTLRALDQHIRPPIRQSLSQWIETSLRLPEGVSALPGAIRLWPYQPGIADAISDPHIERVTLVKPVRVGFTTLLTGAIGSYIVNEPSPILALLPTESDARDYMVSDIEPIFDASPALRGALGDAEDEGGRNTLLSRRFAGGSLKVVAAKSRRNLRRHTARAYNPQRPSLARSPTISAIASGLHAGQTRHRRQCDQFTHGLQELCNANDLHIKGLMRH
jgi:phage terminase large subunit GpA-like protein